MKISPEVHRKKKALVYSMDLERQPFRLLWRDLADYILPVRYNWLLSDKERQTRMTRNPNIVDGSSTQAARILASGMMNGITSPSRPWFKLRLKNLPDQASAPARRWLDEVERMLLLIMGETNFYNALATMYLDLVVFGTSAVLIYEDYKSVFRCYNASLGEYCLANSANGMVNSFSRTFNYSIAQCVERFGVENVPIRVAEAFKQGGARHLDQLVVNHLIEPNDGATPELAKIFEYRELYWLDEAPLGDVLSVRGYNEMPGIFPRWELSGNDSYGSAPGMDALADIIQLQHESKRKAQSLDYMLKPPIQADIQLQNRPTSFMPGGVTFVAGIANNKGAEPIYTVQPPIAELTADLRDVQSRIRAFFHNDLFMMISELDTVRTATEIDARREEKLVRLGPVLERFENEALDPAINRIYSIANRAGLLPPPPEGLEEEEIEIQYVSILSAAQSAVGVVPTERFLQLIGQVAALYPAAVNVPNFDTLLRDYGRDIGVKSKHMNTEEEAAERTAEQEAILAQREAAAQGTALVGAGKTLSETDVGGGMNALQQMLSS